jgi:hypothetical protein
MTALEKLMVKWDWSRLFPNHSILPVNDRSINAPYSSITASEVRDWPTKPKSSSCECYGLTSKCCKIQEEYKTEAFLLHSVQDLSVACVV